MVRIMPKHRSSVVPFEPLDCQINEKKAKRKSRFCHIKFQNRLTVQNSRKLP